MKGKKAERGHILGGEGKGKKENRLQERRTITARQRSGGREKKGSFAFDALGRKPNAGPAPARKREGETLARHRQGERTSSAKSKK